MESVAHHLSNLRRLDVSIGGESRLTLGGMQAAANGLEADGCGEPRRKLAVQERRGDAEPSDLVR